MGGYDFPGSNSGTDLHALTGWIPERIPLKELTELDWTRAWQGLHSGKALLSIATGALSEAQTERAGLVPSHAYAALDLREVRL
jgi:calpain-7